MRSTPRRVAAPALNENRELASLHPQMSNLVHERGRDSAPLHTEPLMQLPESLLRHTTAPCLLFQLPQLTLEDSAVPHQQGHRDPSLVPELQ